MPTAEMVTRKSSPGPRRVPHLFVVIGPAGVAPRRYSLEEVDEVRLGREPTPGGDQTREVRLADEAVSTNHARFLRHRGAWILVDDDSKNGTFVHGRRIAPKSGRELGYGEWFRVGAVVLLLDQEQPAAAPGCGAEKWFSEMETLLPSLGQTYQRVKDQAAGGLVHAFLILGGTGAGKETVAAAIHQWSGRGAENLVALNCAAIAEGTAEDELFGHVPGAFDGPVGVPVHGSVT